MSYLTNNKIDLLQTLLRTYRFVSIILMSPHLSLFFFRLSLFSPTHINTHARTVPLTHAQARSAHPYRRTYICRHGVLRETARQILVGISRHIMTALKGMVKDIAHGDLEIVLRSLENHRGAIVLIVTRKNKQLIFFIYRIPSVNS